MKPNARLAYLVLDHIDAHPEQHHQRDFVCRSGPERSVAADDMPCGTTACFAGWTVLLSGHTIHLGVMPKVKVVDRMVDVDDLAAQLLGIAERGMDDVPYQLFYDARNRESLGRLVAEIFGPRPCPNCPPGYDCERGNYATTGGTA